VASGKGCSFGNMPRGQGPGAGEGGMTAGEMATLAEEAVETVRRTLEEGVEKVIRAEGGRSPSWRRNQVDVPEGVSGGWAVERFSVTPEQESFQQLRCALNPQRPARIVPAGEYTRLVRNGNVVMSDTPDEIRDHLEPMGRARGLCLVNGLGLGVVVQGMLRMVDVERVTVVERSGDVIRLVAPHYQERYGDRVEIVHADAFAWRPPRGVRYDVVWHDVWDDICADNLPEMARLKRRYASKAVWQGCWCQDECRGQRDRVTAGRGWY